MAAEVTPLRATVLALLILAAVVAPVAWQASAFLLIAAVLVAVDGELARDRSRRRPRR